MCFEKKEENKKLYMKIYWKKFWNAFFTFRIAAQKHFNWFIAPCICKRYRMSYKVSPSHRPLTKFNEKHNSNPN